MARRPIAALLTAAISLMLAAAAPAQERQKIGVAFGGGSAKGIAHVGVIRWFEEHRIPIDVAAGTSMGGLIGGCYATGMSSAELEQLLSTMNWDELFGVVELRVQEHPAQDRRARVSVPARVRPPKGILSPDLPQLRRAGGSADRARHRALLRHRDLRRTADAVPRGRRRPVVGVAGGAGPRLSRLGDARDDVAPAHLPAGGGGREDPRRRRRHEQRAGRRGSRDGRRRGDRHQRRRSLRPQGCEPDAVRPRGRHPQRHDARVHEGGAGDGGPRARRAARRKGARLARLAAEQGTHRRGLQGRRSGQGPAAEVRRQRGRVPGRGWSGGTRPAGPPFRIRPS